MKKNNRICRLVLAIREHISKCETHFEVWMMRQYIARLYDLNEIDSVLMDQLLSSCDEREYYIYLYD